VTADIIEVVSSVPESEFSREDLPAHAAMQKKMIDEKIRMIKKCSRIMARLSR
jgi:hypothetical protein